MKAGKTACLKNMASAELEKILRKLLVPDNHVIQQVIN